MKQLISRVTDRLSGLFESGPALSRDWAGVFIKQ